ncbi:MAG: tRNA (adenosine(37)-N6)-threonylcarbamoyltransferase complex ATPase subunit type 1 TsaE [Betaproteobacteria bacterium]|nr:tRNA (adenosine(37)-N6)-threonylcarbamoyltransferase complex ATPase subunit type 1 TsaE [Betaproteobacteria bacterium]
MTRIELPDEAATTRLGAALAGGVAPGRVLFLRGELGAGKTTLVRGLLRALGYAGRVKSPTYGLLELYTLSSLNLYHFDFYRVKDRSEWVSSGFRDYFNPESVCVVEWPERAGGSLAPADLEVSLEFAGEGRRATLTPCSEAGRAWLDAALERWQPA